MHPLLHYAAYASTTLGLGCAVSLFLSSRHPLSGRDDSQPSLLLPATAGASIRAGFRRVSSFLGLPCKSVQNLRNGLSQCCHLSTVSGASFHVVRSSVAPWWSPTNHGASRNVLRLPPQCFPSRYGRFLPVRPALLPEFDGGPSGERHRRDRFNIGEVAIGTDPAVRRACRDNDRCIRPGVSLGGHSNDAGMGAADSKSGERPQACERNGRVAGGRIARRFPRLFLLRCRIVSRYRGWRLVPKLIRESV